jgi:hypothetical protein
MKRRFVIGMVTIAVLALFTLPLTTAAQKGIPYDYVIQDDAGCPVVMFNSKTGQYLCADGNELLLAGVGAVRGTSIAPKLMIKNGVYTCQITVDAIAKTATGYIYDNQEGEVEYLINDSNITNNTGQCSTPN